LPGGIPVQQAGGQRRWRNGREHSRRVGAVADHERVPLRGRGRIDDADDLAQLDGHADRVPDVGLPFCFVGVE
jgi:hypothetical protein